MNIKEEILKLEKQLREGQDLLTKQKEDNKQLDATIRKLKKLNDAAEKLVDDTPILEPCTHDPYKP